MARLRESTAWTYHDFRKWLWHRARVAPSTPRWTRWAALVLRILYIVAAGFRRERLRLRAAALTCVTLLSLVPAIAVAFSMFAAFGGLPELERELERFIVDALGVTDRDKFTAAIGGYIRNIHAGRIGGIGMVFLLVTVVSLLANIEEAFNDIWGLLRHRTFFQRFRVYWPLITVGPLLLGASLSFAAALETSAVVAYLDSRTSLVALAFEALPILLGFTFFTLLYSIMPNTRVPLRAAAAGGVFGGALWALAQKLFAFYAASASTYATLYGSLAVLPVFILWLYISWMVALLGAQLAFAIQSAHTYEPDEVEDKRSSQEEREAIALRLVLAVFEHFDGAKGAMPSQRLIDASTAAPRLTRTILEELLAGGLLLETRHPDGGSGYVPGAPSGEISAADVVRVMRGTSAEVSSSGADADAMSAAVREALGRADRAVESSLGDLSMVGLVASLRARDG